MEVTMRGGTTVNLLAGLAGGGLLMYFFDPNRGRSRRAVVRDKARHAERSIQAAGSIALRDLANRTKGLLKEAYSSATEGSVSDDVLARRVAAKIGRIDSHPHALDIRSRNGVVTLEGPVLEEEAAPLLACANKVRGVLRTIDKLE
jgi:osmotically-inducible protein OsmY